MALIESCFGCSLDISSAALGIYLLVAYIIAFTIELSWILDTTVSPPLAAYFLCSVYFILFTFSIALLRGLSVKKNVFLFVWLLTMGILLGPEASLVLFISINYWKVTSVYGLIEITCWACRLLISVIGILCVQSLQSTWREEKSVLLKLEYLKTQRSLNQMCSDSHKTIEVASGFRNNKNQELDMNNYLQKISENQAVELNSMENRNINISPEISSKENNERCCINPYFFNEFTEFNASNFDPATVNAQMLDASYFSTKPSSETSKIKNMKSCSLTDLSTNNIGNWEVFKLNSNKFSESTDRLNVVRGKEFLPEKRVNILSNLEGNVVKNKHLNIINKISPYFKKKSEHSVNVYCINSPKYNGLRDKIDISTLDNRLVDIYRARGMYSFNKDTKKVVFYPPEFFLTHSAQLFKARSGSCSSTLSDSSTGSGDTKRIEDVAL